MRTEQDLDLYLNMAIKEGLFSTKSRLQFHLETLFGGINFKNKRILDIGGGSGLHSFYAASRAAERVLCLEPEDDGSSQGMIDKFYHLRERLGFNNVELERVTLQEFEPKGETFDVILLHNSINHLNETATINLLQEAKSRAIYKEIFMKIYSLSNRGAKLIICDCSRYNFFALLRSLDF